ncbi:MBL fold metallo-hydrolase, partial [Escherichia coli]|nr:MBL fold metallo-hydrolase [Escherichia coli]
ALQPLGAIAARAASTLAWTYFQADENGFRRTPVLLTGEKEAILLDGGFTLSDGRAVADAIKATGKTLTTIYISCSDPDYYFGLRPIVDAFPKAKVLAAHATVDAIKGNVQGKLDVWGPQLKDNGPKVLADVVIPEASDLSSLDLE